MSKDKLETTTFFGLEDGTIFKVVHILHSTNKRRKIDQMRLAGENWAHDNSDFTKYAPTEIETTSSRDIQLWALQKTFDKLRELVVDDKPPHFNSKNPMYSKGDEDAPFISEGFLYPLLGKEDARTVLAYCYRLETCLKKFIWSK